MSKLNTQLLKGSLEGAMLLIISREEVYGYVLNQRLQAAGFNTVADGTIYPALQKLQLSLIHISEPTRH